MNSLTRCENTILSFLKKENTQFYNMPINKTITKYEYKIIINKKANEKIGNAVITKNDIKLNYEVCSDGIINIEEGYKLSIDVDKAERTQRFRNRESEKDLHLCTHCNSSNGCNIKPDSSTENLTLEYCPSFL